MGMLQGVAHSIGKALRPIHAGNDKLAIKRLQRNQDPTVVVTSDAFTDGGALPRRYAKEGDNVSPPLRFANLPPGTREVVVLCEDPDAPMPHPYLHWLAYRIEPGTTELPEGITQGAEVAEPMPHARQAKNANGHLGYDGPAPPPGHGVHHYHFQVFALGRPLEVSASPSREEIVDGMRGYVIGYGEIVGTYER